MKNLYVRALAVAVVLYCSTPVFAQHGHGNLGSGMAHSADHRANANNLGSSSHGKTIDEQLASNSRLSAKIQSLTGESAPQACNGFKNLGQCVAAAHVSRNLGINFACLKSDMTASPVTKGTTCPAGTGAKSMSLGRAIQALDPTAKSKTEAKKAIRQSKQDLNSSSSS